MHIWVDADACPRVIKEMLFRAAERTGVSMTLVANQPLVTPRLKNIRSLRVAAGFDVADNEIVRRLVAGDLVITADIPLAAEVIAKGGSCAESSRRALYHGKYPGSPQHAGLHGQSAGDRRGNRRSGLVQSGRPAGLCQSIGSFLIPPLSARQRVSASCCWKNRERLVSVRFTC